MESIHVSQRLRPTRYAFIVAEREMDASLRAVSSNTAIWGGIYNPIIPVAPAEACSGLLTAFDPDILVDLTGGRLSADLQRRFERRILNPDTLVSADPMTHKRNFALGINILPLLQHIHDEENLFLTKKSRVAVISPDVEGVWKPFVSFVYGSFGQLPELDLNFQEIFQRILRAQSLTFDSPEKANECQEVIPPIQVTDYDLHLFGRSANFSSHIIYIGDHRNWLDLIEFWNIRATGRSVAFVPIEHRQAFERVLRRVAEAGHYPINPQIENQADLQKAPSISEEKFNEVCDWIAGLGFRALPRRTWRPRFGVALERYVGDIHVADMEVQSGEEMSILEGSRMTPVKVVTPKLLGDEYIRALPVLRSSRVQRSRL